MCVPLISPPSFFDAPLPTLVTPQDPADPERDKMIARKVLDNHRHAGAQQREQLQNSAQVGGWECRSVLRWGDGNADQFSGGWSEGEGGADGQSTGKGERKESNKSEISPLRFVVFKFRPLHTCVRRMLTSSGGTSTTAAASASPG